MISGTNGIMGASDTTWVLMKDKRSDGEVILYITGRDVEQSDTVIRFNKDTWRWEVVGEVAQLAEERARAAYDQSSVVTTIKKLLEQSQSHRWSGTAKELMEARQGSTSQRPTWPRTVKNWVILSVTWKSRCLRMTGLCI